jgi:phosphate transport system permease protein
MRGWPTGASAGFRINGDGQPAELLLSPPFPTPITALTLLIGDRSLVVGARAGRSKCGFRSCGAPTVRCVTLARSEPVGRGARACPFPARKGFPRVGFERRDGAHVLDVRARAVVGKRPRRRRLCDRYAPKADGALVAGTTAAAALAISAPHPEVSLRALFGRVWYEGYEGPAYSWQSSSGTEDFEPKLSLTPLLFER